MCICFFPSKWLIVSVAHFKNSIVQRFEMPQLPLNTQVFRGPILSHWSAHPSIPTCGTSWLTSTALARDYGGVGEGRDKWPGLFKAFYQRALLLPQLLSNRDKNFTPQRLREKPMENEESLQNTLGRSTRNQDTPHPWVPFSSPVSPLRVGTLPSSGHLPASGPGSVPSSLCL